jgi:Cu+-exporting ATPase
VLAGTVNGSGAGEVTVRRAGEQTALWGVVRLVEQAQSSKPPIQRIADRVAAVFVPSILVLALGTFAWWFIATRGGSISEALLPAVAVLLVSCPCALGLATPTAITVGAGLAAEHGILIRDASGLESLYTLDAVVLDKTGTLTHGSHEVTVFKPLAGADGQSTLALAASVESRSEHVLSRAVVRHARKNGAAPADVAEFESIAGMGVRGVTGGRLVVVGNAALMRHLGIQLDGAEDAASELRTTGHTVIFAAVDGKVAALIALADIVREEARPVMAALRRMGLKILMVTGDTRETAISVGRQAGISPQEILSEVRPEDKANVIRHLKKERMKVGMVGDGVNDAPALAEADVGIAMATGTDVAIEAADVTLGRADLNSLLDAIRVSRATMRTIKQNLFWAFVYNMTLIPMAAAGKLHPMYAALAMSLSSVTVVVNSLWIRRVRVSRVTPPGI